MNDVAFRAEGLSKQYRIGGKQERYKTLRDTLTDAVAAPFRRLSSVVRGHASAASNETIWALKDVSFEVKRGEVVGVIGRNGAGKTTLLKALSRITEPTEGYAEIHGRVGSLLEVGTGFHPELTGRENIYLNGAILGMKRAEIDWKFDEIVAFAEVEKLIDTPVKHYSSGMYVRLAFAVAAHLEPEILLVDEVLAVGDASFQKKCLGKMGDVAREGRTVLFVSHNMAAVNNLCKLAILLNQGKVVLKGSSDVVIDRYLAKDTSGSRCWEVDIGQLRRDGQVKITTVEVLDLNGQTLRDLSTAGSFALRVGYQVAKGHTIPSASFIVRFKNHMGVEVLRLSNTPISGFPIGDLNGTGQVELVIPKVPFTEGQYSLDIVLARQGAGYYVEHRDLLSLHIRGHDAYGSGLALSSSRGISVVTHRWIHLPEDGRTTDSGWIGHQLLIFPETQWFRDRS
jgi:lipopolysaccharide transport system ATP-binding protein